jgi:cyclase
MSTIGIMPCLDMKEGRVVKGIHFVDLKDAGDPVENAAFYQQEGADELAMLDIAATVENRKTRLQWVRNVSSVIDIPLTVGGGISTLEDIESVLEAGAEKVSMNSAAVGNPDLVKQAAEKFGSDKVTVAIDARRNAEMPSGFELVVSGGTRPVGQDAVKWAQRCQQLAAGAILPTSMDGDGTQAGYDIEFTRAISSAVKILLAASVFHYRILSIRQVKEYLRDRGLTVVL